MGDLFRDDLDLRVYGFRDLEVRFRVLHTRNERSDLEERGSGRRMGKAYGRSVVLLSLDLFGEDTSGRGDETEESGGWVERASTELGVSLETGKVRVFYRQRTNERGKVSSRLPSIRDDCQK